LSATPRDARRGQEKRHFPSKVRHARTCSAARKEPSLTTPDLELHRQATSDPAREAVEASRLRWLVEASSTLLRSLRTEDVLPKVLEVAQRTLDADAYSLWQLDPETGTWGVAAYRGLSPTYVAASTAAIDGADAEVSFDRPIVAEDIAAAEWLTESHRAAHAAEGNRAMIAAPLKHDDEPFGTLVFYFREPRRFTNAELDAASTLANLASTALTTSRLYERQREMAEDRRLIAEASELLASSLDYELTLANVASLAVRTFADWCVIDMVEEGKIKRLATAHAEPEKVQLAEELGRRYPPNPDAEYGAPRVIRTGVSELVEDVPDELLVEATRETPELLELLRSLGLRSSMCVPLRARDRVLGAMTFVSAEGARRYTKADLATAEDLARRAATAVDNALLLRRSEESRALLDTLFATAPVGLAYLDAELRYERINDALAAINGRSIEEHLGRDVRDVLGSDVAERLEAIFARVLQTGQPVVDVELGGELPTQPGTLRHWVASYFPVRDQFGDINGLGVVVTDVTENRRAHAVAEAARERLAVLADASQQLAASLDYEATLANIAELLVPRFADWYAVDVIDDDGTFRRIAVVHRDPAKRRWARKSQELYGGTRDEPEGPGRVARTGEPVLYRTIPDELLASSTQNAEHYEVLRQLGIESAMVVPLRAGGRTFGSLMLVSGDPNRLYDEDDLDFAGHLARRAAVAVDNARLYRAAHERARAALVVEHVADGVLLVDRDGVIRLWNPSAERVTGLAPEEVVGRRAELVFPSWASIAPVATSGGTRAEMQPVEINGRELWLSVTGVEFDEGSVFAFRDLTAERAVEHLKSDFVATVSHELRTPLAAIYGAALTLRREDMRLAEPQRSGLLEVIATESDRLARIVNDILWASRLESGTMHTVIEQCDAVELARSVVDAAAQYVPPNISLSFVAHTDVPPVAADRDKVRQVLANLVENAIKYSPDGGPVEVTVATEGTRVRFCVSDEGLGIPPAERERIFEKFYRLDPNLTRGVGGTGLGLYISRELVQRMGGRIWVAAPNGRGSMFVVELVRA
jgi:PAS domain S-box-containing protein